MATFIDEDENTSQATEDEQFDTLDDRNRGFLRGANH